MLQKVFINFFFIKKNNSKKKIIMIGDDSDQHELHAINDNDCEIFLNIDQ